jgi:hypothetical protein
MLVIPILGKKRFRNAIPAFVVLRKNFQNGVPAHFITEIPLAIFNAPEQLQ